MLQSDHNEDYNSNDKDEDVSFGNADMYDVTELFELFEYDGEDT